MYKVLFLLFLLAAAPRSLGQHIIIGGQETSRKLVWSDFTGKPDASSSYSAYTWWTLSYSYSGVQDKGDSVQINGFDARLQLDPQKSWVKKGKETDDLLGHEQGHFDIGILCMNELVREVRSRLFPRQGYQVVIRTLFTEILQKYNAMGTRYDTETEHGKNREQQNKWALDLKEKLQ